MDRMARNQNWTGLLFPFLPVLVSIHFKEIKCIVFCVWIVLIVIHFLFSDYECFMFSGRFDYHRIHKLNVFSRLGISIMFG